MWLKTGERSLRLIRILNTIFYFLVFFPLSLVKRSFGKKSSFKMDKNSKTYWIDRR
jgi:hypothetical protein